MSRGITIGYDDRNRPIILPLDWWLTGVHAVGSPGSGKSKALENLVRQIIRGGHGLLLLDPHGPVYEATVAFLARYRLHRPVYLLNFSDPSTTGIVGFNPFLCRGGDPATRVQRGVTAILKSWSVINPDATPRLLRWLKNTLTLLIERGDLTIADLPLLFAFENDAVRAHLAAGTSVEDEWRQLNQLKTVSQFDDQIQSTKNRLDILASATTTRRFLSVAPEKITLDLARAMEERAIVLCNLQPSPVLDPRNSRTIGSLILSELFDSARQRKTVFGRPPRAFFTLVDEVQNFLCVDLPEMFAQGRKYGIPLIVCHQFLDQLRVEDPRFLSAVHGAARTKVVFGIGAAADARELAGELFSEINLREVKLTQWRTAFRPSPTRERSVTRTRGGGTSWNDGTTETEGVQTGVDFSDGAGQSTGRAVARSQSVTRGVDRTESQSVTDTEGESDTIGTSHGVTTGHAHTDTGSSSETWRAGADGVDDSVTHTAGQSSADTHSESTTDTLSENHTTSRSRATSRGTAVGRSASISAGASETDSLGDSVTRTHGRSFGESSSTAESQTHGGSKSWSEAITDQPGTRHEEFREPTHDVFSLEEQLHRLGEELRRQPQRYFTIRTPDGKARCGVVPELAPVRLSPAMIAAYEAEIARQTGALTAAQVDDDIQTRQRRIKEEARQLAAQGPRPVHSKADAGQRTTRKKPLRPNVDLDPAVRKKKKPSKGTGGEEGQTGPDKSQRRRRR